MLNVIENLLRPWTAALTDWRTRQRAYAELASLDDRSLADIGITRTEIPYVLSQAAAEKPHREPAPTERSLRHAA